MSSTIMWHLTISASNQHCATGNCSDLVPLRAPTSPQWRQETSSPPVPLGTAVSNTSRRCYFVRRSSRCLAQIDSKCNQAVFKRCKFSLGLSAICRSMWKHHVPGVINIFWWWHCMLKQDKTSVNITLKSKVIHRTGCKCYAWQTSDLRPAREWIYFRAVLDEAQPAVNPNVIQRKLVIFLCWLFKFVFENPIVSAHKTDNLISINATHLTRRLDSNRPGQTTDNSTPQKAAQIWSFCVACGTQALPNLPQTSFVSFHIFLTLTLEWSVLDVWEQ